MAGPNMQDDDDDDEGDPADVQAMKLHFKQVRVRPHTHHCRGALAEYLLRARLH